MVRRRRRKTQQQVNKQGVEVRVKFVRNEKFKLESLIQNIPPFLIG